MASESVTILIEAEDNATAVLQSTTAAVEATTTAAKSAGSELAKMATVQDDLADMTSELEEMGESLEDVAKRTDDLAKKTGNWASKLKGVAGSVTAMIGAFTGGVAIGKQIGEWVFQTKQLEANIKAAADEWVKIGKGNADRDQTVLNRQIEMANLEQDPAKKDEEIAKIRDSVEEQIEKTGLLIEQRKAEKKAIDNSWTALESEKQEAAALLKIEEDRFAMLNRIHDKISEDTQEYEKQKAAKIAANNAEAKAASDAEKAASDSMKERERKQKQQEKDRREREKGVAFRVGGVTIGKEQMRAFEVEQQQAEKADRDKMARAKQAISIEAKLRQKAYAELNAPGLNATEGRLLSGGSANPVDKVVINTQQIVDYMAAEQAKLDAMVKALEANGNAPTFNILP